ncbi:Glu/Leu/Phe/Val family dehydrogenase [Bosea sp. 685]|uniref:Glu/Leu/Phe/Val family dehydrogenase n=1 Tax=Bosea sp. 685 TaxID=3080057 RepID=UPI002892D6BD|nr:Glu/Leu/Phe/Val dehydrogenase dimerization domain-containing protein [Bosea sp. 685]WNJ90519.1 Glu/Leu/Phe/Val dehydrogenase dimerization domain-containing protein [Bosea sp. 685]
MTVFRSVDFSGHEQVVHVCDPATGLRAIIAVHSTALGPAIGGCRIRAYADETEALTDVLRLSRGMSLKAAVAGVPFGGGKMVVMADPRRDKTPALLRAVGVAVARLGGRYVTGEDLGTTVADMAEIGAATDHVLGLPESLGGSGDPSPRTALGCFVGIAASVRHRLGKSDLKGVRVAVQGLGNVGWNLSRLLAEAGAELIVSDVREELVQEAVHVFRARPADPQAIHAVEADVFSPCALGAAINDITLPELRVSVVAGAANNQLADEVRHDAMLRERGILYAPDYVINGGGMIQLALERIGLDRAEAERRVRAIGETLSGIYELADEAGIPTAAAARNVAQERLTSARARAA